MTDRIDEKIAKKKQAIAKQQDEIARLQKQKEKRDNGMKYVVAGAVLVEARSEPKIAKWLADTLEKNATREADKKRVIGLIDELRKIVANDELAKASQGHAPIAPTQGVNHG